MCGRFNLVTTGEEVAAAFELSDVPQIEPRYNIAPTQPVAAIRLDERGERELTYLHWGLILSWARDRSMASRMINARSETVAEKPAYRAAFKRRRCLIPATGFYEWQKANGKKQPMNIGMSDSSIFALAGLWEDWQGVQSCTIITGAPNELVGPIHNRMPVILEKGDYELWLDLDAPLPAVQSILRPLDAGNMRAYPVSTYVNSARNEGPACIAPLA